MFLRRPEAGSTETAITPGPLVRILVLLSACLSSAPAAADEERLNAYIDLSVGHSTVEHWNAADLNFDGSVSNTKTQDTDAALRIAIGYGISDNFMVEFGHLDLGQATAQGTSDGSGGFWAPGPVRVTAEVVGYDLGVIARMPASENLSIVTRAGILMWTLKSSVRDSSGGATLDDGGSDAFLGIGLQLTLSDWVSFRADFTRYGAGDLDVNTASASAILRMP
jgi:hypothetical protein